MHLASYVSAWATSSALQVENELLAEYEGQLLEKEHSGCAALLQDDKVPPLPWPSAKNLAGSDDLKSLPTRKQALKLCQWWL